MFGIAIMGGVGVLLATVLGLPEGWVNAFIVIGGYAFTLGVAMVLSDRRKQRADGGVCDE